MLFNLLDAGTLDAERGDVIVFNNTSAEHPATYDFVRECKREVERVSVIPFALTEYCIRDGRESWRSVSANDMVTDGSIFEAMLKRAKQLPNRFQRICTDRMKLKVTRGFLAEWFAGIPELAWQAIDGHVPIGIQGGFDYVSLIGLRHDEDKRYRRILDRCRDSENIYAPLHSTGINKDAVSKFWGTMPFDLAVSSDYSNCVYCFMKGKRQLRRMAQEEQGVGPAGIEWWAGIEREHARPSKNGGRFGFFGLDTDFKQELRSGLPDSEKQLEMACFCTD